MEEGMKYNNIVQGVFKSRPNRFIAYVEIDGMTEIVHVKNTGRCKELLLPDAKVVLEISDNPARKTKYDLIGVYKDKIGLVNMDSQAPNKVVGEWLGNQTGRLKYFENITLIKPEYTYGKSRIDFYFEYSGKKALMEVKGVTLEKNGTAYFPDAPTLRGIKHLEELERAVNEGYESYVAFVIQMEGADYVYPNMDTHPEFGHTLERVKAAGVKVLNLGCKVEEDGLSINRVNESEI